jgi:putative hydrolase of the HAD superfamily
MNPASRMRAVGFDFDHTLGIDHKLERTVGIELLEEAAREHGCPFDSTEASRAMDNALERFRSGFASLEDVLREQFARVACRGASYEGTVLRFRAEIMKRVPAFVEPLMGARALLERMENLGIPYALLSNGWSPLQEEKAALVGFRGAVFVSDRIGAWKPSPRAFEVLIRHFNLPPPCIYYVGDDPVVDVEGARQAGLVPVWYDHGERVYPMEQAPPTHHIRSLGEFTVLLSREAESAGA